MDMVGLAMGTRTSIGSGMGADSFLTYNLQFFSKMFYILHLKLTKIRDSICKICVMLAQVFPNIIPTCKNNSMAVTT